MSEKPKVGISIGDVNGIGLEIIIKTLADSKILNYCTPIVYGHIKVASFYKKTIEAHDLNFNIITSAAQAQHKRANLLTCWEEEVKIEPGLPNKVPESLL